MGFKVIKNVDASFTRSFSADGLSSRQMSNKYFMPQTVAHNQVGGEDDDDPEASLYSLLLIDD